MSLGNPESNAKAGLYHIITRANNRQLIFGSDDDYLKLLSLLAEQKLLFYIEPVLRHFGATKTWRASGSVFCSVSYQAMAA